MEETGRKVITTTTTQTKEGSAMFSLLFSFFDFIFGTNAGDDPDGPGKPPPPPGGG